MSLTELLRLRLSFTEDAAEIERLLERYIKSQVFVTETEIESMDWEKK